MLQKGRHKLREYSISSYCIPYMFLWIHYCLFYKKCQKFQEKQMNFATFSKIFNRKLPFFTQMSCCISLLLFIRKLLILQFFRHAEFISASLLFNETLKQVQYDEVIFAFFIITLYQYFSLKEPFLYYW